MPRTYRHNVDQAARLEPDRCEVCRELPARHVVHTYPTLYTEFEHLVCGECLPEVVRELAAADIEYRVGMRADHV